MVESHEEVFLLTCWTQLALDYAGAFIFEDLGVTAYNGAGTLITSPVVRQAAESKVLYPSVL